MTSKEKPKIEIRDLRDGNWYWINERVFKNYVKRIGALAMTVYNALAYFSNEKQKSFPSQSYLGDLLGYSRSSIHRALKRLEQNGLIKRDRKSHCIYTLLNPKCVSDETRMYHQCNINVAEMGTNDNKLSINNNDNIAGKKILNSTSKEFEPKTKEELLALDIAIALSDRKNLPFYLNLCQKYPESFLRRLLAEVKEIPYEKIRKNRAALFNYLLKKYAKEQTTS